MNRSLYTKLVLVILVIISSLMTVAGAFLLRGVREFYVMEFYTQMESVFSDQDVADHLYDAADDDMAVERITEVLSLYSGRLGIDASTRNFYILSGDTAAYLSGSTTAENGLSATENILMAINGESGYASDSELDYMDVALPIEGEGGSYIVYVRDNKESVRELNDELFEIILEAMGVGLLISLILGFLLAKTLIIPIQDLTQAVRKAASGDFSEKPENTAHDEIGVLTRTFNEMSEQLESTLSDLTKSEEMRREFVANVSHELRTPITSIRSYTETMEEDPDMPSEMRNRFLNVVLNESDRMAKIVADLLTLSRFDAGSIEFDFAQFSFDKSVRDIFSAMEMEAASHGHNFKADIQAGMPEIRGDKARVEQVLMNMISNAVKYTRDGGRISVNAGHKSGEVWCTVRDNGIGIPECDVDKVFDRFYRVDKARSRESGGTGLGLSIAKEIVLRHGGSMELRSKEGKGTVITMRLPMGGPEDEVE